MAKVVAAWIPSAWSAFVDYRLEAITFSRMELEVLRELIHDAAMNRGRRDIVMSADITSAKPKNERKEFAAKLAKLLPGLPVEKPVCPRCCENEYVRYRGSVKAEASRWFCSRNEHCGAFNPGEM